MIGALFGTVVSWKVYILTASSPLSFLRKLDFLWKRSMVCKLQTNNLKKVVIPFFVCFCDTIPNLENWDANFSCIFWWRICQKPTKTWRFQNDENQVIPIRFASNQIKYKSNRFFTHRINDFNNVPLIKLSVFSPNPVTGLRFNFIPYMEVAKSEASVHTLPQPPQPFV